MNLTLAFAVRQNWRKAQVRRGLECGDATQSRQLLHNFKFTMAYPLKGSWTTRWYRSKASTLMTQGDCLDTDGTDIVSATSSSGGFLGIIKATKAASDATNARVAVWVPRGRGCTFAMDHAAATSAIEGRAYDYSDATTVGSGTTYKPLRVEKVLSATLVEVSAKDPIA